MESHKQLSLEKLNHGVSDSKQRSIPLIYTDKKLDSVPANLWPFISFALS